MLLTWFLVSFAVAAILAVIGYRLGAFDDSD